MGLAAATSDLHVVHVLSSLLLGGQEQVALDLASAHRAAGLRVSVVSLAPPPDGPLGDRFRSADIAVKTVGRGPGLHLGLPIEVARWLTRERVDLVHTHNRMALLYGATAGALAGRPVVHTKHGANPIGGRRLMAARWAARLVDAFVAVSPETAEVARRRGEVAESKLSVINNGIDLDRFRPDPAARQRIRAELGVDEQTWLVGTVGRLAPEKEQALLLRAAAPLLGAGAHLVVAGDGPLREQLARLAVDLGVAPFVHLLGARADVPAILNALDLFVLSSSTEGLPLVIPEAMATGLAVVSTAVGGIPTVLEEGQTGFLVRSGDEEALRTRLRALRDEPALGRACAERGRLSAVSRFSADRMQADYLELYGQVVARRGRRPLVDR